MFAVQSKRIWRRLGFEIKHWLVVVSELLSRVEICDFWDSWKETMIFLESVEAWFYSSNVNTRNDLPLSQLWDSPRRPLIGRTRRRWRNGSKRRSLGAVIRVWTERSGLVGGVLFSSFCWVQRKVYEFFFGGWKLRRFGGVGIRGPSVSFFSCFFFNKASHPFFGIEKIGKVAGSSHIKLGGLWASESARETCNGPMDWCGGQREVRITDRDSGEWGRLYSLAEA